MPHNNAHICYRYGLTETESFLGLKRLCGFYGTASIFFPFPSQECVALSPQPCPGFSGGGHRALKPLASACVHTFQTNNTDNGLMRSGIYIQATHGY